MFLKKLRTVIAIAFLINFVLLIIFRFVEFPQNIWIGVGTVSYYLEYTFLILIFALVADQILYLILCYKSKKTALFAPKILISIGSIILISIIVALCVVYSEALLFPDYNLFKGYPYFLLVWAFIICIEQFYPKAIDRKQ